MLKPPLRSGRNDNDFTGTEDKEQRRIKNGAVSPAKNGVP